MSTQHIKMGGAPEGYDAQLVLRELHSHGEPVVHIARDDKRMSAMIKLGHDVEQTLLNELVIFPALLG